MKNVMMTLLCFMVIICMDSVFGMDNKSEKSDSSNGEEFIDLTQYTKQELNFDNLNSNFEIDAYDQKHLIDNYDFGNYKSEAEYCIQNVSNMSENNSNGLKRKKKPEKILLCEDCQRESNRYIKGKFSGKSLCKTCYTYESRHGTLGPQDERNYNGKHKNQILACEICHKESKQYVTGKFSDKSLCNTCYQYEYRHVQLGSQVKRNYNYGKHKDQILVCETCQKESKQFVTGQFSGKSLCKVCYNYEYRHGDFGSRGERRYIGKHNQILVCEVCQKESKQYVTSKFSSQSLCKACYNYESLHGDLRSQGERNYNKKHKDQILVCESCQKESKQYVTGKFSGKSLCQACYYYESRHGRLRLQDERNYNEKHKDQKKDSSNRLFDAENS